MMIKEGPPKKRFSDFSHDEVHWIQYATSYFNRDNLQKYINHLKMLYVKRTRDIKLSFLENTEHGNQNGLFNKKIHWYLLSTYI